MTDETTPTQPSLATFLQGPANAAVPSTPKPGTQKSVPASSAADDRVTAPELDLPLHPTADPDELAQADRGDVGPVDVDAAAVDAAIDCSGIHDRGVDQDDDASPGSTVAAPSFARESRAHTAPPADTQRWQWGLVLALALLLGLQIILADRAKLAADAGTRPLVSGLCTVLQCTLPAWHEPSAFSMLSRDIRPVPGQAGALQVQTSFRNDARWAQAWPALRLSLSDADGRVIGRRTLQPAEYLGPDADPQARLEPGQSAQVSFRLREPAAATVAFSFEFQ